MRRRPLAVVVLAATTLVTAAACGDEDPNRTPGPADIEGLDMSPDAEISVDESGFDPSTVTIRAGDVLLVRNTGDEPHEIADLDEIDSGRLEPGDEITIVLLDPGRFTYRDALEPDHEGTVVVEPAQP